MVIKKGTCVLFRTQSISEVRFFRETNYDAGKFELNILYIEVVRLGKVRYLI